MVLTAPCFKCKKDFGSITSRDGPSMLYCVDCFTEFISKNVRDHLFSQCYLPCDTPVAMGVSGGNHSLLLLHLLGIIRLQGQLRQGAGRVSFVILPFHLREDDLVSPPPPSGVSSSPPRQAVECIRDSFTEQLGLLECHARQQPCTWQYASSALYTPEEVVVFRYSDFLSADDLTALRMLIHHPRKSLTEREEVYDRVKRSVLALAARRVTAQWVETHPRPSTGVTSPYNFPQLQEGSEHGWVHLLLGDGSVNCAVSALHAIVSRGGGDHFCLRSAARGYEHQVVTMRPLRTLLPKEVVLYNRIHGVIGSYTPVLSTGTTLRSMHTVLESFVLTTMQSYRTSIFNILNMVSKVQVHPEAVNTVVRVRSDGAGSAKPKAILGKTSQFYRDELRRTHPPVTVLSVGSSGGDRTCTGCGIVLGYHCGSSNKAVEMNCVHDAERTYHLCAKCLAFALPSQCNILASPASEDITFEKGATELLRVLQSIELANTTSSETLRGSLSEEDRTAYVLEDAARETDRSGGH